MGRPALGDAGDVPTISRFYGIVIRVYFSDHVPPHFRALYADQEAVIAIASGTVLRGGGIMIEAVWPRVTGW